MKARIMVVGLLITVSACLSNAQSIDGERMERDIKVAENILATLISGENRGTVAFPGASHFTGSYVEGYGVMFNTSLRQTYWVRDRVSEPVVIHGKSSYSVTSGKSVHISLDSIKNQQNEEWKEAVTTFLIDYANLIGQLKAGDRVMVTQGHRDVMGSMSFFLSGGEKRKSAGISMEIKKEQLNDFKQGKLNREQTVKKINIIENLGSGNVSKDVQLLASIFERLYQSDLSSTYYTASRLGYEHIPEFGVIYSMRVYSSVKNDKGLFNLTTRNSKGLNQKERDEKVGILYPEFLNELKRNILQYGRTVTSLKNDEILMFKVKLTQCKGCDIPSRIELSIKASDLKNYNAGKISENDGVNKISLKEISNQ